MSEAGYEVVRVLLAGAETCRNGLLGPLDGMAVEVVGHARSVGEAILLADRLQPDIVLLEPKLADGAHRLARWTTVVTLLPEGDDPSGDRKEGRAGAGDLLEVLRIALALASAAPRQASVTTG